MSITNKYKLTSANWCKFDSKQCQIVITHEIIGINPLNTVQFTNASVETMAPQFTMEERNFLMLGYAREKGSRDFMPRLLNEFAVKFPNTRVPHMNTVRKHFDKQVSLGTINNVNSVKSPGVTHSGRRKTVNTNLVRNNVRNILDQDSVKELGDRATSPVSTARKNSLRISKSSWSRICCDIKYHPYKPIRRQELKQLDLARRVNFCQWISNLTDNQLGNFLFSDEANFELNGCVNSQNVRRYAPLKSSDPMNGGRPDHFVVIETIASPKV